MNRHGQIENFPSNVLGEQRDLALLFKNLATLRTDAPLFDNSETLRWRGATPGFAAWAGSDGRAAATPSVAKRLLADDDALLAPGPNFKTVRSPAIYLARFPIGSVHRAEARFPFGQTTARNPFF